MLVKLTGAFLLTYFVSRAVRHLLRPTATLVKLVLVHALSLAAIAALVLLVRFPSRNFVLAQLTVYLLPQAVWLALDALRGGRILRPRTTY